MSIPEARKIIDEVVDRLTCPVARGLLLEARDKMRRRYYGRKAAEVSNPMTPAVRAAIEEALINEPKVGFDVIARRFKVNAGRVSEIHAELR